MPSTEPAETFLRRHSYGQLNDIRQISAGETSPPSPLFLFLSLTFRFFAGTKDHDRIPENIRPVVFRFFASQHRRWLRQSEDVTSAASDCDVSEPGKKTGLVEASGDSIASGSATT